MIQLLNIAGTGPIFGTLMGAVFGPVVFLWIVLGSVLGGAVHDYMSGMISSRHDGKSVAELSGLYLGKAVRFIMRIFCIVLLLCGTIFVTSPAALLAQLTPDALDLRFWVIVILVYYVLATLLRIDKVIGRLYPVFAVILIIMALGIIGGIVVKGYTIPEITLKNLHPDGQPVWPFMFVTVACGAISGFHAAQSPMVAKCITTEKAGRKVFYGAMICESLIALVWAAAGVAYYGATSILNDQINTLRQSGVVYEISTGLLGTAGAILANLDFSVLWRYGSWSNQTLAMISLWVAASWMIRTGKKPLYSLLTALPAAFMSAVSVTYILMAPEGFRLSARISYPAGALAAAVLFSLYLVFILKSENGKTKNNM